LADAVTNEPEFFGGLVDTRCAQQNDGIKKDNTVGWQFSAFNNGFFGFGFNATDKVLFFFLPKVKILVALVIPIQLKPQVYLGLFWHLYGSQF